jgi:exodeoxyribonuclease-1
VDVDEDLYGGFLGPQDRTRLDRLRKASPDDPAWQTASFDDPRLEELVFRYRARNFPDSLGRPSGNAGSSCGWRACTRARAA